MVKKKIIPNLNVEVSTLGFGGMRFPTIGSEIDQNKVNEMVDCAIENGINYFDTAYVYHDGKSESAFRESLKKYDRSSYLLADKMPEWVLKKEEDLEKVFNEQLERAGVDYFDFYLAHSLEPAHYDLFKDFKVYDFMKRMKDEGKIRFIGFSFHGHPELLEEILRNYKFDFAQIQLNYYDWDLQKAKEQYKLLEDYQLPCIVMESARGGFLTNFNDEINKMFKDARENYSIASWAFRWLISLPNVYVALSGMSDLDQMKDNIDTFTKYEPFTNEDYKVIDNILEKLLDIKIVPCTACRYCMPCPFGVDIPRNFSIYNDFKRTGNSFTTSVTNITLEDKCKSYNCVKCMTCVPKCPQHIDIPTELEKITKEFKEM